MSSFAYTNSTNFRPFSYEELLAPLLMATQAHQEVEEAYGALGTDAGAVGSLIDQQNDPDAYALYKAFNDKLSSESDALSKRGLTPASRQNLINMRRRYANDITKIQNAITRRREMADEQRKGVLANPTLMYQRNFNTLSWDTSLDRFLENPEYNYGDVYSGALITKQVSEMASHLATELRGVKSGRLDAYTKTFLKDYGLTSDEVLLAINNPNDPRASKALAAIYDSALSAVPHSIRTQYADQVKGYAQQGFWSAIGKNEVSPYEDFEARAALEQEYKKDLIDYQYEKQKLQEAALLSEPVYSQRQRSDAEAAFNKNMKDFSQYFDNVNGKYVLNDKGKTELKRKVKSSTYIGTSPSTYTPIYAPTGNQDSAFKKFMDSLGMKDVNDAGSLWSQYMQDPVASTAGYDAQKYNRYAYRIDPSDQAIWKDNLLMTAANGELKEVEFDGKTGQYKETGSTMSVEDLNNDKTKVLKATMSNLGPDGRGNTVLIKNADGVVKEYKLESGINVPNEEAMMNYINYAALLETVPDEGGFIQDRYGNPVFITKAEAEVEHRRALQSAQAHLSQLGLTNKTKPQEFNGFSW